MADDKAGVVIEETQEAKPEPRKSTLEELAEELSAPELEIAKKQGLVFEPPKPDAPKPEEPKKVEDKKPEELAKRPEVREAFENPEKEQELLKTFNKNETGLYWSQKKERERRKSAEIERDHTAIKLKAAEERAARLEAELKVKPQSKKEDGEDIFGDKEPAKSEDDKPVTVKDLKIIEAEKDSKAKKEAEEQADRTVRGQKVVSILNAQEADAKSRYEDFDSAMDSTVKILANVQNLSEMFPDRKLRTRVAKLINYFCYATANADKFEDGDYNAADVAYELGKLHPDFKPDSGGKSANDDGGILPPEQADKAIKNSGKRGSSAALPAGGGKRFVPYEEMTVEHLARLSSEDFAKVPKAIRERILSQA